ncbi:hypothetical protein ACFLS1_07480 [Verrucomicrobiota bacterium]
MKNRIVIVLLLIACLSLSSCATSSKPSVSDQVSSAMGKIKNREGRYFGHVWSIIEADGGVPALIELTQSDDQEIARISKDILVMFSGPSDKPKPKIASLTTWWKTKGSKMSHQDLWHNFDSHHK